MSFIFFVVSQFKLYISNYEFYIISFQIWFMKFIWFARSNLMSWFLLISDTNFSLINVLKSCSPYAFTNFWILKFPIFFELIRGSLGLFIWFSSESIWLVKNFVKIWNLFFWIWEFVNSFGEHLKLDFKINDICCRSRSSSFCRLGCWGCNYNILLHFCILHPLRDSWDQIFISLIHYFTNSLFALWK